jgi:hypothetical protein
MSIDQGTTFNTQINLNDSSGNPVNLASYTVESQMRKSYTSSNAYNFTVSANSSGIISLSLSANASDAMDSGRYLYDVLVEDPLGNVTRIIEGQVTINAGVSR